MIASHPVSAEVKAYPGDRPDRGWNRVKAWCGKWLSGMPCLNEV